jgi:hypothetical protein
MPVYYSVSATSRLQVVLVVVIDSAVVLVNSSRVMMLWADVVSVRLLPVH